MLGTNKTQKKSIKCNTQADEQQITSEWIKV